MIAKIVNGVVTRWPLGERYICTENPSVSFAFPLDTETLASYGFVKFQYADQPTHDLFFEEVTEVAPALVNGIAVQQWQVVEKYSPEERERLLAEREVEREKQQRTELVQQIASRRWQAEVGGITVNGIPMATDRDSQALITGAALAAMRDPAYVCRWKTAGGFVALNAEQLTSVADTVRAHVQACFDREAALLAELEAGTLTPDMLEQGWPA